MHDVIEHRRVEDGRGIELFAGDGGADNREDARADDGSDAERCKRDWPKGLLEAGLGVLRLADELIDGFTAKNLGRQSPTPLCGD